MADHRKTDSSIWAGRISEQQLYLHEKVQCVDLAAVIAHASHKKIALLGYACEEGVKRNQGRIGTYDGADAIRKQLAKMPNHLNDMVGLFDVGSILCLDADMETAQTAISENVFELLQTNVLPILLGGGHDIAYGHYNGIKKFLGRDKSIGIINFDAHFDLRNNTNGNNSGTPFYQIAKDCKDDGSTFNYLCLGIRKDANDRTLFQTAHDLGVNYVENINFSMCEAKNIVHTLLDFIRQFDHIYVTIDLDGFSSAYAPGVSAASPMGFSPKIVIESLELIINSKKMISLDIAEMNPLYDTDYQTAKLAASLVHFVIHRMP